MGGKVLGVAVAVFVAVNVWLVYALLHPDDGSGARRTGPPVTVSAGAQPSASPRVGSSGSSRSADPSSTAGAGASASSSPEPSPSRSAGKSASASHAPSRTRSPHSGASPTAHPSHRTSPSPSHATARKRKPASPRIVLTRRSYVTKPHHVLAVSGRWRGAPKSRRAVHVQVRRHGSWSAFPLPAVLGPSGRFTAYVDVGGRGTYRLRVVAAGGGVASQPARVTVR